MRVVIQRVTQASVSVEANGYEKKIGKGLMVLVGFTEGDSQVEIDWMSRKIASLRVFDDKDGTMNLSVMDIDGEVMIISQFTLYGDAVKGNRPSYIKAAPGRVAEPLYNAFCEAVSRLIGKPVSKGVFGADMKVGLVNDGPVTIQIDSKPKN